MRFSQRGFSVIELVIILVVIGILGGAGYAVARAHRPTTSSEAQVSSILADVKQQVTQQIPQVVVNGGWQAELGAGIGLAAPDYSYKVNTQSFQTLYLVPKGDFEPTQIKYPQVVNVLVSKVMAAHGFIVTPNTTKIFLKRNTFNNYVSYEPYITYSSKNATCIYVSNGETLSCYSVADAVVQAAKLNPLATVYLQANPKITPGSLDIGPMTIKSQAPAGAVNKSNAAGYDIAEAVVSSGETRKVAIFYNKQGGSWIYITQADDEFGFSCAAYKANPDVEKAMNNQICLGPTGQVRLDTTNRALQ